MDVVVNSSYMKRLKRDVLPVFLWPSRASFCGGTRTGADRGTAGPQAEVEHGVSAMGDIGREATSDRSKPRDAQPRMLSYEPAWSRPLQPWEIHSNRTRRQKCARCAETGSPERPNEQVTRCVLLRLKKKRGQGGTRRTRGVHCRGGGGGAKKGRKVRNMRQLTEETRRNRETSGEPCRRPM